MTFQKNPKGRKLKLSEKKQKTKLKLKKSKPGPEILVFLRGFKRFFLILAIFYCKKIKAFKNA